MPCSRCWRSPPTQRKVVAVPYSGNSQNVSLGAAGSGQFAVGAPRSSSVSCPSSGAQNANCADAEYAIGHELGHTFGRGHSCDVYPSNPSCGNSIVQAGKPWNAILLPGGHHRLAGVTFFP
ncbi:MAG: hypothetical protein E6Q88_11830 [Lysobacteraceae bacterium]|nr:MAG: hypothetical protein E6Q88_11830 [Xanthomonadaceae bacterium]